MTDQAARHCDAVPVLKWLRSLKLVLASASPRRREILARVGLAPRVVPSTFAEDLEHAAYAEPVLYATATAEAKALEVYRSLVSDAEDAPDMVIAADTIVVLPPPSSASSLPGKAVILEKASNPADALDMLRRLHDIPDATHEVITAVVLVFPSIVDPGYKVQTLAETTKVTFGDLDEDFLQGYIDSLEWTDKAGAYAIQGIGGALVKSIEGDYNNVVGFPLFSFLRMIQHLIDTDEFEDL